MSELQAILYLMVGSISVLIGKGITAYLNERDKFRGHIISLQAQVESQGATIAALRDQINLQVSITEQQAITIAALKKQVASKDAEILILQTRITRLEETILQLTSEKLAAEQARDEARGEAPESGEGEDAPAQPDMGDMSAVAPKRDAK